MTHGNHRLQVLILVSMLIGGMIACRGQAEGGDLTPTPTSTQTVAVVQPVTVSATSTSSPTFTAIPTPSPTLETILTSTLLPTDTPVPQLTPTPQLQSSFTITPQVQITPSATPLPEALATLLFQSCPRQEACIRNPMMNEVVSGVVEIRGAARRPGFKYYKLEYQLEGSPDWHFLDSFERPVRYGTLAHWRTSSVPSGTYVLRLVVVDKNGNYWPETPWVRLIVVNDEEQK